MTKVDALKGEVGLLNALHEAPGNKNLNDFDLICHIAYDAPVLTKAERASNVRKRGENCHRNNLTGVDTLLRIIKKSAIVV